MPPLSQLAGLFKQALGRLGLSRAPLPRTPRPDDVYLVSYPKSGSTWLRFLLGSCLHGPLERLNDLARVLDLAAVELVGERVAATVEASRFERMQRLEARAKGGDGEGADLSDEEHFIRMRGGSAS